MRKLLVIISLAFLTTIFINANCYSQLKRLDSASFKVNDTLISPLKVKVINLSQKNWWDNNSGLIGVLLGTILGFLLNLIILRHQLKLQKKNDWINNFRNNISELLSLHFNIFDKLLYNKNYKPSMYDIRPDKVELRIYEDKINFYTRLLSFYLVDDNHLHKSLLNSLDEVYNIYKEITKERKENYNRETVMEKIDECSKISKEIIDVNK